MVSATRYRFGIQKEAKDTEGKMITKQCETTEEKEGKAITKQDEITEDKEEQKTKVQRARKRKWPPRITHQICKRQTRC